MPRLVAALVLLLFSLIRAVPAAARGGVEDLEEAVRRFRQGDFAGAVPLLEQLHAEDPADLDSALLLGIAYQRTGREREAEPLLRAAATSTEAETRESARTFLDLASGRREEAESPLSLYLLLRPEWDSNVALASGALPAEREPASDGALLLLGSAEGCLGGAHRICLGDTFSYRRLLRLTNYDALENLVALGYRGRGLALGYGLELVRIGGAPFELGHIADARWRAGVGGGGLAILTEYRFAWRGYEPETVADLSGPSHTGLLGVGYRSHVLDLKIGATPSREDARTRDLSSWGAGGRADVRWRPIAAFEASLSASLAERWFDEGRRDLRLFLDGSLSYELSPRFALLLGGTTWLNDSTDEVYRATRTTLYAGVDVALDGP